MREAIHEARKAMGRTQPNPAVGAVILHRGAIIARGHTQPAGGAHAEIMALRQFASQGLVADPGTQLVVTLEPCSTVGRTGACTEAIISSGIRKVGVGATDPNPAHRGRGFEVLRGAGIEVTTGLLEGECEDLNLIFNWRMSHDGPFVAAKIATTLDGFIATRLGLSKWITGREARADVHRWRRYFPAIAVGAGTILADNPSLTARIEGAPEWAPTRFIFDRNLISFRDPLPRVYADECRERSIVITDSAHREEAGRLQDKHGLQFWGLEENDEDGGLGDFSKRCLQAGIEGLLIEGGAQLLSHFIKYRAIHYLFAYRAPKLLGDSGGLSPFSGQEPVSMEDSVSLRAVRHQSFGDDQLMRGFIVYP